MTKAKVLKLSCILLTLLIFLTACGKNNSDSETDKSNVNSGTAEATDEQTSTDQSGEAQPAGKPVEGGSIVLGITQEPDSFHPYLAAAAGTKEIIYNFFDGLVKLMPDGSLEPALAEKIEVADDAREYTFKIRKNVTFHNGQELTADDVVYSLQNAAGIGEDGTLKIAQLALIEKVEAEGDTVTVTLKESDSDFLSYMTLAIIPRDYHEQETKPVGTGPFVFTEYKPQQYVKMRKNEHYWREHNAYLDEVNFLIMPSADAAIVDLQAGNIDIFPYLTMDKKELLQDQFNFIEADSNMVQIWGLNNAREPFNDPLVRRAMNMAVDKKLLIDTVTFGQGKVLESGMAPAMGEYYASDLADQYDPEGARKLLEENGYTNLTINITVPGNYMIHVQTAEVIAAQLEAIGVKTNIISVDWATWLTDVYQGKDHDSTVIALTFDYVAPGTVLRHYYTGSDANFINFSDPDFDALYEQAKSETDHAKKVDLYWQMQKILQEQAASVFLQNPGTQTAVSKKLAGYTTYPQYVQDMYNVYFVE